VLRPEHGLLRRGERAERGVAASQCVQEHGELVGVDLDHVVHAHAGGVAVDVVEAPRLDPEPRRGLGVRPGQRVAARRTPELCAHQPQVGLGHRGDATGDDPEPDGAARVVLGSGQEQLGHSVQGGAGAGEVHR
jgi:hypothetical protein